MSGTNLSGGLGTALAPTAAFVESLLAAISDGTAAAVSGSLSTLADAEALLPEGAETVFAYEAWPGDPAIGRAARAVAV